MKSPSSSGMFIPFILWQFLLSGVWLTLGTVAVIPNDNYIFIPLLLFALLFFCRHCTYFTLCPTIGSSSIWFIIFTK